MALGDKWWASSGAVPPKKVEPLTASPAPGAGGPGSSYVINGSGINGISGFELDNTLGADAYTTSMWEPSTCVRDGHRLVDEMTYDNGEVGGRCDVCGDKIIGRRLPGGLGTMRLRELVDGLIDGKRVLAEALADAVVMLEAEEAALEEARRLVKLAQLMLQQLPPDAPEMTDPAFTPEMLAAMRQSIDQDISKLISGSYHISVGGVSTRLTVGNIGNTN